MFDLSREVRVKDTSDSDCGYRITSASNASITEYESKTSGYKSLEASIHNAQLDTLKTKTRTIKSGDGTRFKVKTIEFLDSDGVSQSIKIFGERY
jgi:hypothetical protein